MCFQPVPFTSQLKRKGLAQYFQTVRTQSCMTSNPRYSDEPSPRRARVVLRADEMPEMMPYHCAQREIRPHDM
ncbi:unnamed protein product [Boreogadus saida]